MQALCCAVCLVALSSSKLFLSAGDYLRVVRKTSLNIKNYVASYSYLGNKLITFYSHQA